MDAPRLRGTFVLAGLLATAACGSSDQGPNYAGSMNATTDTVFASNGLVLLGNTLDGTFGAQVAGTPAPFFTKGAPSHLTAAQRALAILDRIRLARDLARGEVSPGPSPFPVMSTGPSASAIVCAPTETGIDSLGNPIDTDGDGIPDDYVATFSSACSWLSNGLVYSLSGSYRVRDTGTDLASFAFTATNLRETASDGTTGEHITHTLNGTETATFASAVAHHKMDFVLVYNSLISDTTRIVTFTMSESSTYTPDLGSSFTPLGALPAGSLDYSGDFRITGLDQNGNFRFILDTPTPIHTSPACGSEITGGIFEGLLNGTASKGFTFTWNSCAVPTLEYFGANTAAAP